MQPPDQALYNIQASLAEVIRTTRLVIGVTQDQLAQLTGISRATIAAIEMGAANPRLQTIVTLANHLDLSITDLFSRTDARLPLGKRTLQRNLTLG